MLLHPGSLQHETPLLNNTATGGEQLKFQVATTTIAATFKRQQNTKL